MAKTRIPASKDAFSVDSGRMAESAARRPGSLPFLDRIRRLRNRTCYRKELRSLDPALLADIGLTESARDRMLCTIWQFH